MTEEQVELWKQKKNKCEECGNIMPLGYAFCNQCGAPMQQQPVPIDKDDFKKIKQIEIILFLGIVLLLFIIVVFPIAISVVHSDLVFRHAEDFAVEKSLQNTTIALSIIIFFVDAILVFTIRILSKRYWDIVCKSQLCIVEERKMAIALMNQYNDSLITRENFNKQRKALSQKIFNTKLKIYL
ncbi:MAG: zinc ribbon domain-containing protein [Bacteroides sp.]|nr:zinc ribbon domain-containing protein [Bacillota bacterium]MCM1393950.1 zinc ribbon domain-containing protein [[Eubacterium] siraeum]MCM1455142.1 zinc ribbon domain-containing protein [Bacteroides sp.]